MQIRQCFWRWKSVEEGEPDTLIVVTDNTRVKIPLEPMVTFYAPLYPMHQRVLGYQFRVLDGSREQKELFAKLGISEKDEIKEKRKRRKRADNEQMGEVY